MKKFKKLLLAIGLTCACSLTSAFLVSCKKDSDKIKYSFNTNGGVEISAVTVDKGEEVTLPTPEKEGYEFEGWYTSATFEGEPVTTVSLKKNTTFYAKWAQLPAITLELDGGSLSKTTLYLKAGENVYEFMKDYTPTKAGVQFGAWFDGETELAKTTRMPKTGLTLSAKYKVAYTVELWLQSLTDETKYERSEETVTGYEYAGVTFESLQKVAGFEEVRHQDAVTSLKLSDDPTANVLKYYFNRKTLKVTFHSNYPDTTAEDVTETVEEKYGVGISVPSDYEFDGYCLIGWSTSRTGNVMYQAHYVDTVLYNNEAEARPADVFTPDKNTALYAVWAKGYVDMFGGSDSVYLLGEEGVAYVSRGNVFFKGEYDEEYKEFFFENETGDIMMEGKLYDDGTFAYYSAARAEGASTLYENGELVESTKIYLDTYNGLTYSVQGEDEKTNNSKGTYTIDKDGYYVVTFSEGDLAGKTMTLSLSKVTLDDKEQAVFRVRNEEEMNMGELVRFVILENGTVTWYLAYEITLNGFGFATYNMGNSEQTLNYTLKDGVLTLTTLTGGSFGEARVMEYEGQMGYTLYTKGLDQTFSFASGDSLKLSGGEEIGEAVYTMGGKEVTGYYNTTDSLFGGKIVTMFAKDATYKFLIEVKSENVPIIDETTGEATGETETVVTYTPTVKPQGYAEYQYLSEGIVYSTLILVLDDTTQGKATVYSMSTDNNFVKVSSGTYEKNADTDYYVYNATKTYEVPELQHELLDLTALKAFVFQVDSEATSYRVVYWYSSTMNDGATTEYIKEYTAADGATLKLVGGFAFLTKADGVPFTGAYAPDDDSNLATLINGNDRYYVELADDGSFILLQYAPYTAYLLDENNKAMREQYITFDGKGNATYVVVTKFAENEDEEDEKTEYVGTAETLDEKTYDADIALFKSNDGTVTFKYIRLSSGSVAYIAKYNETYNGTYESADGILTLDGFGYKASFIDAPGHRFEGGRYSIVKENVIRLYFEDTEEEFYFDLSGDGFTVRGQEYGEYIIMENQYMSAYVEFDGYTKAGVYQMEKKEGTEDEYERVYIDENGEYSIDGDEFTITYKNGNQTVTLIGKLDTLVYSNAEYPAFTVIRKDAVRVYVNEKDWSVLILDELGNATKYTKEGAKEQGSYTVVTDEFLYYVNDTATDACIYVYDFEKGTATPVKFTARGYYTTSLESLLFSEYGFATFNGTTRYYYNVVNGNVTIYRQDPEAEGANKYGFVSEDFGKFDSVKVYNEKTYYANNGFAINFARAESTKNLYPVQIRNENEAKYALEGLSFQPGSGEEFTVRGTVILNGTAYDCYVVRELNENKEAELYVNLGYYRFYIDVNYQGVNDDGSSNNTYEVVALRYVRSVYSYTYLNAYYWNAIFFGSVLENTYGMVYIKAEYNENGEMTEQYITGEFGERGLKDMDDNIISFEKGEYGFNKTTGVYSAQFVAEDGYTYKLYFGLVYHSAFGFYGYQVVALARVQTLEIGTEYSLQVESIMATDLKYSVGDIYTVILTQKGETDTVIAADVLFAVNNTIYYVVRTKDEDGKITSTKYYHIKLVEEERDTSVDDNDKVWVPFYQSATVTVEDVTTVYTADGKLYVDISEERGVTFIAMYKETLIASESTYDAATSTYTVKVVGNRTFTVKLVDGAVEIAEVTDQSEEA